MSDSKMEEKHMQMHFPAQVTKLDNLQYPSVQPATKVTQTNLTIKPNLGKRKQPEGNNRESSKLDSDSFRAGNSIEDQLERELAQFTSDFPKKSAAPKRQSEN